MRWLDGITDFMDMGLGADGHQGSLDVTAHADAIGERLANGQVAVVGHGCQEVSESFPMTQLFA